MKTEITKAVILNKGTISWFSKGSLHNPQFPSILNRSFLEAQLNALRKNGISEIHMLLVDSASEDEAYSAEGLIVHRQAEFRGTAGAMAPMRHILQDAPFIILNASTYVNEEQIAALLDQSKRISSDWAGTFAVFDRPTTLNYAETINFSKDGNINGIYRAHRSQNRRSSTGLAGLYLLSNRCLEHIPDQGFFDLKEQLFPELLKAGLKINALHLDHACSILTANTYLSLQFRLLREQLESNEFRDDYANRPVLPESTKIVGAIKFGRNNRIGEQVTIVGPVLLGDDCVIEEGATIIGPAVIGNRCRFGAFTWVQNSVLHDRVALDEYAQARHCLLGEGHQVVAADQRYCVDTLAEPLAPHRNDNLVDHEVPQVIHHYDMLNNAYTIAKYQMKKRVFDILVAGSLLVLTLPLWILIAIAIRLESRGPVFYAQKRCGIHGREFPMLKFRTMLPNAHQMQDALRQKLNEVDGPVFKMSNDPRLTKVGQFLRKTSLDELPQLINVLMGDMSCVGPRPLAIKEMTFNPHWRDLRLMVKPGLTGLWQVRSRDDPRFHAWIENDIEYVRNQSIWRDIRILLGTVRSASQGV